MRFWGFDTCTSEEGKVLLSDHGFRPLEEVRIGGYDLFLVVHRPTNSYHLAVQRIGLDFTNLDQQKRKIPNRLAGNPKAFTPILKNWIKTYGQLYMASHNLNKNESYVRVLRKLGFKVTALMQPFYVVTLTTPSGRDIQTQNDLHNHLVQQLLGRHTS